MKKMMFTLMAFLTIAVNASAMSYEQAREEALFLTDKMAYELNLTDAQYEAAYEINLDYLMGVTSEYDVFGPYWERRNLDLSYILFSWQWDLYRAAHYFYRPLFWERGYWHFGIYARYPHRDYFYFGRPHFYTTYRGGHSWRMNNGRSFYEGRRDFYRPGHVTRDTHFGMRSGWDRGDYRPQPGGGGRPSSTHITGGGPGNPPAGGQRGGFGSGRGSFGNGNYDNGGGRGGFDNGNRGGGSFDNGNRGGGSFNNGGGPGSFGGSRSSGSFGGSRSTDGSFGNSGASTGGIRGSFGNGGGSTGGSRGSFGNGGGSTGGSFGGSRSSGSFGGSRSTGGSVGGGATRGGGGGGSRGGFGGSRR